MTLITVIALAVNMNSDEEYFGDETGTPEYYMVKDTLHKYLGEDNVYIGWDYDNFIYTIENIDEGCDNTCDYTEIINNIYEPFAPFNFKSYKKHHLAFQIL